MNTNSVLFLQYIQLLEHKYTKQSEQIIAQMKGLEQLMLRLEENNSKKRKRVEDISVSFVYLL